MGDRKMGHVQPLGVYLGVYGALLVLTLITWWASTIPFNSGLITDLVALGIAGVKASLVTLFFMHGKYEGKLTWGFVIYPAALLLILMGGLFLDYHYRADGVSIRTEPHIAVSGGHGAGDHSQGAGSDHSHGDGADHSHGDGADHSHGDGADHSHGDGADHSHGDGADHSHDSQKKDDGGH